VSLFILKYSAESENNKSDDEEPIKMKTNIGVGIIGKYNNIETQMWFSQQCKKIHREPNLGLTLGKTIKTHMALLKLSSNSITLVYLVVLNDIFIFIQT